MGPFRYDVKVLDKEVLGSQILILSEYGDSGDYSNSYF